MSRWLARPGVVAVLAFVGGAAVAAIVVLLIVVFVRDGNGDDESDRQAVTTPTARATAAASPTVAAGTPTGATPTPGGPRDADAALEAFVRDELDSEHIGDCAQYSDPAATPEGICSIELYRSEELVTFTLGPPFSEGIGEAVLTPNQDGSWSVSFVEFGPLGETVALGSDAVVYGAGNCLRFREAPSLSAAVETCQIDGTKAEVVEGPREADGHTWWRLEGLGWASEQFLRPAGE